MTNPIKTKICIIGAGPGGSVCSLFLAKLGIPSILVDKAIFPRDKICGDAFSGKVLDVLLELDPLILKEVEQKNIQTFSWGVKFIAPNLNELKIPCIDGIISREDPLGFLSKRIDFDNFLVNKIKKNASIEFMEGIEINSYEQTEEGWVLKSKDNNVEIHARLLIIADGAHSYFAKNICKIKKEPSHYCAGLRLYYSGISNSDNFIELHFLKELLPGYFWIMPLPNGFSNVGIGMRSDLIAQKKINLRKMIQEIIQKYPHLTKRFENAEIIDNTKGYGLPLGSKYRKICGHHFMVVGDAASLIDPFTGEGIGNAMISGMLAAKQAVKCVKENNYSESFLMKYEEEVYRHLMPGLKLSHRLQRLARLPWLFNAVINKAHKSKLFTETISYMFVDIKMRKRLDNPLFYLRVLFSK